MDTTLISASCSYFSSSFLVTTISVLTSIVTVYFLPKIFKTRSENWKNGPPGPIGWPIVGNLLQFSKNFHEDLFKLSMKYGPIVSLKMGLKPAIVVSSPEMAFEVLKLEEASFYSRTITEAIRTVTYNAASIIWIPHGARWTVLRRIMISDILSNNSLLAFEQVRRQQVILI